MHKNPFELLSECDAEGKGFTGTGNWPDTMLRVVDTGEQVSRILTTGHRDKSYDFWDILSRFNGLEEREKDCYFPARRIFVCL